MTRTDLTVLTNQLMLAIDEYAQHRHDAGHAAGEEAPAQLALNAEFAEEAYAEVQRYVRVLSALVPTEAK